MKFLLLLMMVPVLSYAQNKVSCDELEKIAANLEQTLMKTNLPSPACQSVTSQTLRSSDENDLKETIENYKCSNLSVIEANIRNLEGEMTLLQGIQKLKADIQINKDDTRNPKQTTAAKAGENFLQGVEAAQSLELLFSEANKPDFLNSLKTSLASENDRNNPEVFKAKVRSLCGTNPDPKTINACHLTFNPSLQTIREINVLLTSELSPEKVTEMRETLAIKKTDNSPYSFYQLQNDLAKAIPKLKDKLITLTRDELKIIRSMPDFQNTSNPSLEGLKNTKKDFKIHTLLEEFKFLNEDLENRQKYEIQSKVDLTWKAIALEAKNLTDDEKKACGIAYAKFESAKACFSSFEKFNENPEASGTLKTSTEAMRSSIGSTINYLTTIQDIKNTCLTPEVLDQAKKTGTLTPSCEKIYPDVESALSKKQNQIEGLNALKDKIASENQRIMKFRNYTIEALVAQNCVTSTQSTVGEFCPEEMDLKISREVMVLSSKTSEILGTLLFVKPTVETKIEELCEADKLLSYEQTFCDALTKKSRDVAESPDATPPVISDERLDVENRRSDRAGHNAWVQGTVNLAGTIASMLYPPPTTNPYARMYNQSPYPTNYAPYVPMRSPSISDSLIMTNSRYTGSMGSYNSGIMPTGRYFGR